MNKYTGDVEIDLNGAKFTLCYDWRAISEVQTKHGVEAFQSLFKTPNPLVAAEILLCGLRKHHPDLKIETLLDMSPPIIPVIKAIDKAISVAFFGAENAPEDKTEVAKEGDEKKT